MVSDAATQGLTFILKSSDHPLSDMFFTVLQSSKRLAIKVSFGLACLFTLAWIIDPLHGPRASGLPTCPTPTHNVGRIRAKGLGYHICICSRPRLAGHTWYVRESAVSGMIRSSDTPVYLREVFYWTRKSILLDKKKKSIGEGRPLNHTTYRAVVVDA